MVDSICRDSADTQYTITPKKMPQNKYTWNIHLAASKLIKLYDTVPFIFECLMIYNKPSSIAKVLTLKVAKMFFFLLHLLQMG